MLQVPQLKKLQQEEPYLYEALQRIVGAVNSLGNRVGVDPAPAQTSAAGQTKTAEQSLWGGGESTSGTWTNPGFCLFANFNIGRTHTSPTDGTCFVAVSGFASLSSGRTALRLEAYTACASNTANDLVILDYSTDGGASFTAVYAIAGTFPRRLDKIALAATQDVTKVQVRLRMPSINGAHNLTMFAPRLVETLPM